jgi:3',5'-cyclic AMP phosphodiesterase CpdA
MSASEEGEFSLARRVLKMPAFTIAHLSDLHLTARPGERRFEPRWNAQLTGMNDAFRHVAFSQSVQLSDLVLVTGDVTDKGDPRAWKNFKSIIAEARLTSKTLAIVGNHDVCGLGARLGWPPQLAKVDLAKARDGLTIAGQPSRYPWVRIVDPRIAIFGLDTNNSGNLTAVHNAVGRISSRQLQRFAQLLARHKDVRVKIAAIHHSPNIPTTATAIRRGRSPMSLVNRWTHQIPQSDRRAFRQLCIAGKVRLVIHGHLHQAEDRRVNGIRMIGAPATTEPVERPPHPPRYQFFQYTVGGNGGRVYVNLVTV